MLTIAGTGPRQSTHSAIEIAIACRDFDQLPLIERLASWCADKYHQELIAVKLAGVVQHCVTRDSNAYRRLLRLLPSVCE